MESIVRVMSYQHYKKRCTTETVHPCTSMHTHWISINTDRGPPLYMTISENLSVIDIYLLFFVTSRITYLNGSLFLATFYFTFSLRSSTFYEILITSGALKNIFVAWQKNQDMTTHQAKLRYLFLKLIFVDWLIFNVFNPMSTKHCVKYHINIFHGYCKNVTMAG